MLPANRTLLLAVLLCLIPFAVQAQITVDDDGADAYSNIQDAINAANDGDVIEVEAGMYGEDVTVDKELTLEGPNAGTAGDGNRSSGEATIEGQVVISASGVVFDGFDVSPPPASSNSEGEALRIGSGSNGPDNVIVKNNIVRDFEEDNLGEGLDGIIAFGGSDTDPLINPTIADNLVKNLDRPVSAGGAAGISIQGNVDGATVEGNTVQNIKDTKLEFAFGIVVRESGNTNEKPGNVTITNNDVSNITDTSPFAGVGFGVEERDENGSIDVTGNEFSNIDFQVEDKTETLDRSDLIQNNNFDPIVEATSITVNRRIIFGKIQAAVDLAAPGATVTAAAGTYQDGEGTLSIDKDIIVEGASRSGVTIKPSSSPVCRGVELAASGATLKNVTVDGNSVAQNGTCNNNVAVVQILADNATVQNVTVDGPGDGEAVGINLFDTDGATIENALVKNTGKDGINVRSRNVTLRNLTLENNAVNRTGLGGIGIYASNSSGASPDVSATFDESITFEGNPNGLIVSASDGTIGLTTTSASFTFSNTTLWPLAAFSGKGDVTVDGGTFDSFAQAQGMIARATFTQLKPAGFFTYAPAVSKAVGIVSQADDPQGGLVSEQALVRDLSTDEFFVGQQSPSKTMSIQTAVNEAPDAGSPSEGETVNVLDGTYDESVTVDKNFLTLQDASTPTVNAFDVAADNVTINGFEITGGTTSAGSGVTVGIYVQSGTSGHTFSDNNLMGDSGEGVSIKSSVDDTQIKKNNISGWDTGIFATGQSGSVDVDENCITGNEVGISNSGFFDIDASGNWWGAPDGPSGEYPGSGDKVTGTTGNVTVNFSTEPVDACLSNNDGQIPQAGKPEAECTAVASDAGLGAVDAFAKYEDGGFDTNLPGGSGDISFTPVPSSANAPTVPEGIWDSSTEIAAFLIKQSTNIYYWENPGTTLNYVNPEDEFSHITFCVREDQECDTPALAGDDDVDKENGTVSNTITDDDGINTFTFTKLEGLKVVSDFPSDFSKNGSKDEAGVTWTWEGNGDPPTSVDFTLGATKSTVSYFVEVTDACPGGANTLELDPRYEFEFGADIAQPRLAGSAPNPFSGQTTVEFALPKETRVTVAIYDMLGRKVATLVDGTRRAGTHTLTWNGRTESGQALSSGVYLMRMRADGQSETQRVTVVR